MHISQASLGGISRFDSWSAGRDLRDETRRRVLHTRNGAVVCVRREHDLGFEFAHACCDSKDSISSLYLGGTTGMLRKWKLQEQSCDGPSSGTHMRALCFVLCKEKNASDVHRHGETQFSPSVGML
jgi:hypothetical protein